VLEPVYRTRPGEWPKLIIVLEVQAPSPKIPSPRSTLLHRVAGLYDGQPARSERRVRRLRARARCRHGNEQTLGSLELLGSITERWPEVAKLYDSGDSTSSPTSRNGCRIFGLRTAQIYEVRSRTSTTRWPATGGFLAADPENQPRSVLSTGCSSAPNVGVTWPGARARKRDWSNRQTSEILESSTASVSFRGFRLNDLDSAIGALPRGPCRRARARPYPRGHRAPSRAERNRPKFAEILEPLYQTLAEWEKLHRVFEAQLTPAQRSREANRLSMYYRIAELAEEQLSDVPQRGGLHAGGQGRAARRKGRRRGSSAWPDSSTAGVSGSPTPTPTCSDFTTILPSSGPSVDASHARFEEELGDNHQGRGDLPLRARCAAARRGCLANLDRIYTSLEQWAVPRPGCSNSGSRRRPSRTSSSSSTPPRRDVRGEARPDRRTPFAAYPARFSMVSTTTHEGSIHALSQHSYEQDAGLARPRHGLTSASSRTRPETSRKRRSAPRSPTSHPTVSTTRTRAIETWKRVLDLRGEDPEALGALANLYESAGQWPSSATVARTRVRHRDSDELRVEVLKPARPESSSSSSAATSRRSPTTTAFSISTMRTSPPCAPSLPSGGGVRIRTSSSLRCTRIVDRATGVIEADELKATFRVARQDVRRSARPAVRGG